MLTTMTVYKIITWQKTDLFLETLGAEEMPTVRGVYGVPQHCAWMSLSLADIAARHSSICRRISILFRQQTKHATAPNTTTSMILLSHGHYNDYVSS